MSENAFTPRGHIVVGVDGSPSSILALQHARKLSAALSVRIEALIAWDYPPYMGTGYSGELRPAEDAKKTIAEAITMAYGSDTPPDLTTTVTRDAPARALLDASREAEMLVVGSRGHGGFIGLMLGSVSSQCAEHALCPVLVVHTRDHL